MTHPVIDLENVSKRYGKGEKAVDALNGLNLQVPAGSLFGLLGPNGAGTTTTLRILATLLAPSSAGLSGWAGCPGRPQGRSRAPGLCGPGGRPRQNPQWP